MTARCTFPSVERLIQFMMCLLFDFLHPVDEDSDCTGETTMCLFYKCSNEFGFMDNNCVCRTGYDCDSGRCEGTFPFPMCQARLAIGGSCNENSDCLSNFCSWKFVCDKAENKIKAMGIFYWILIVLACLGALYGLYRMAKYFLGSNRNGYTEVVGNENNM